MSSTVYIKQPSETKEYAIDFANLLATGDSLAAVTSVTGTPSGLTITGESIVGTTVAFTVAGGADGVTYTIEVIATTTNGETLEGDGYLVVTDTPTVSEDALSYSYTALKTAIADFLGWGRNTEGTGSDWTVEETARMDAIIKSAVTQVYYPVAVSQAGTVHQWSWMRPVRTLTTSAPYKTGTVAVVDGVVTLGDGTWPAWAAQGELTVDGEVYEVSSRDSDTQLTLTDTTVAVDAGTTYTLAQYLYDLPADFNGFDGGLTYKREQSSLYGPVELVSDGMLRRYRQGWAGNDRPRRVAIRPKTFVGAVGQRWQAAFHPTPSEAWDLQYRYKVQPTTLSDAYPFPLGGPEVGELILESCLAVAEQRYRDEHGIHTQAFLAKLAAAVANDAMSYSPDFLGYNSDRSEERADRFGDTAIHSYEGVVYYDRNP